MFRIQSVRWPASFLTSARNFPSPDRATFSSVPVFVIWLKEIEVKGTERGHRRQAAKPPAASRTKAPNPMASAFDFFTGAGATAATLTALEDGESESLLMPPLGGAPLGLDPVPELGAPEGPPAPGAVVAALPVDPPLLLRCNLFRSARSSAADCRRSSRSFSSVLLSVSSNSIGNSEFREIGAA